MTEKQKIQKGRAYFKFILAGLHTQIDFYTLTEYEREEYATIINIRDELIEKFDANSRLMGLNVPKHKCWCKKPAKTQILIDNALIWVCNKHKDKL